MLGIEPRSPLVRYRATLLHNFIFQIFLLSDNRRALMSRSNFYVSNLRIRNRYPAEYHGFASIQFPCSPDAFIYRARMDAVEHSYEGYFYAIPTNSDAWVGKDSNPQCPKAPELQSGALPITLPAQIKTSSQLTIIHPDFYPRESVPATYMIIS